jgi:hypothetical protein
MLKIKDNIDLKELEKFGFKKIYPNDDAYFKKVYLGNDDDDRVCYLIKGWNRFIKITRIDGEELDDTLFDLIQAGLVEKVSD